MNDSILVVDDDEGILEVIQIVLEGEGYEITTCMNADDLHPLLDKAQPDLILLDVLLLGQDGRKICRSLKSDPQTSHIPIIMLSAHSDVRNDADDSGADDFLEKPFDVDELIHIVARHLPPHAAHKQQ